MIQFDVLVDPRWQANIEEKQGRFQLDRSRSFAVQHRSMVYNPRDHEWIANATKIPWAIFPGKNPEHEYHAIHTPGWSLQMTNITLSFDVTSEHVYYGKVRIKCNIERGYCAPNHAIKATVVWEPEKHCQVSAMNMSSHTKQKYSTSQKNLNSFINKIGLARFTLMSNSMQNLII